MSSATYNQDGDVGIITMDDGKANAMNPTMIGAVNDCLDQAERDAKAVILTGRENVLSGGFDLKIIRGGDPEAARAMSLGGARLMMRLYGLPKPLVLATRGHSVALGGFMLLTGDYRIGAAGDFTIGLNEVAIGMTLPPFGLMLARARLASNHLQNATINANLYDPAGAVAAGFLDEAIAREDVLTRAGAKAAQFAQLDSSAFIRTKLDFRGEDIERIVAGLGR